MKTAELMVREERWRLNVLMVLHLFVIEDKCLRTSELIAVAEARPQCLKKWLKT